MDRCISVRRGGIPGAGSENQETFVPRNVHTKKNNSSAEADH